MHGGKGKRRRRRYESPSKLEKGLEKVCSNHVMIVMTVTIVTIVTIVTSGMVRIGTSYTS